jgi:hypothetical protein
VRGYRSVTVCEASAAALSASPQLPNLPRVAAGLADTATLRPKPRYLGSYKNIADFIDTDEKRIWSGQTYAAGFPARSCHMAREAAAKGKADLPVSRDARQRVLTKLKFSARLDAFGVSSRFITALGAVNWHGGGREGR